MDDDNKPIPQEIIDSFEQQIEALKDKLICSNQHNILLHERQMQIANLLETSRRIFVHFAETGEVSYEVI